MILSIILAAGEGTRMRSNKSKVVHKILNKPMIEYILQASEYAGADKNVIIVGENEDIVKDMFGERVTYKRQYIGEEYPYGTGYAVGLAQDDIGQGDQVLILNGDIPLLRGETLKKFIDYHKESGNDGSLMTAFMDDPESYGRIVKKDGYLVKIVEDRDCTAEERLIKEWNPGIYIFDGQLLKDSLEHLSDDNSQGELYITDVVEILTSQGKKIGTFPIDDSREVYGINSKDQLAQAQEIKREWVNQAYMEEGVIMENPSSIFIEPGVEIGIDTEIRTGARITGQTVIGSDCLITGDTEIADSVIGDGSTIRSSFIESSKIGSSVIIGPYSHLRPDSLLEDEVHLGNFVEIKNAQLGKGTKAGHHAYIGDARLGEGVNIGCGVIFANYDGKNKHFSTIKDGAFIGSNTNIVSPVVIGKDGFVAAGSTVTEDVGEGALYVNRAESRQLDGWVYRNRKDEE